MIVAIAPTDRVTGRQYQVAQSIDEGAPDPGDQTIEQQ